MPLQLNTPPVSEPVSLAEAKAHLKVDTGDDDALITSLIGAARARAEWHTGRAFITQGWTLWLDRWPGPGAELPLPPLQTVASVRLYAPDGGATVLDADEYQVAHGEPARVVLNTGVALAGLRAVDAVAIAFTAGYGDASAVPALVREAILDIVASLYANRGDGEIALDALALLEPYRILKL